MFRFSLVIGAVVITALDAAAQAPRFATTADFAWNSHIIFDSADVDLDGDADLITAGTPRGSSEALYLVIYRNDGRGLFAMERYPYQRRREVGPTGRVWGIDDLDGDGDLDILFPASYIWLFDHGTRSLVYLNDGTGRFTLDFNRFPDSTLQRVGTHLADFDRDGDLDAFMWGATTTQQQPNNPVGQVELWLNDGRGYFTDVSLTHTPVLQGPNRGAAVGDLNGDGWPDAVVAEYGGPFHVLLNDGTGRLQAFTTPGTRWVFDVQVADVDADGDLDVFLGGPRVNEIWLNDGQGSLSEAVGATPSLAGWTLSAAFADFDLDGDPDLVTTASGWQSLRAPSILVNDGTGRFTEAVNAIEFPILPPDMEQVLTLDLDGDGDQDIWGGWAASIYSTCAGFLNLHRQQLGPRLIPRGATYELKIDGQPGHLFLLAFGTRLQRLSLPNLGIWALDLRGVVVLPPIRIPPSRTTTLRLPVPTHRSVIGTFIASQAIDALPSGTLNGAHVTNWWVVEIQ